MSAALLTVYDSVTADADANVLLFRRIHARAIVRHGLCRRCVRRVRLKKQAHDKRTSRCAVR
jgi:hypothetical protein